MPRLRCPNAPATARLFMQLSMRLQATVGLEVLQPATRSTAVSIRAFHQTSAPPRMVPHGQTRPSSPWKGVGCPLTQNKSRPQRQFSTSSPRRATQTIFNPQVDEEGKEMILEITARAAERLSEIMAKDGNPHLALRIQVESGGCHGFQYLMKLVTLPSSLPAADSLAADVDENPDAAIREDDTIFTHTADESNSPSADLTAPKIILDTPSLQLLKGSKVDFTMELIGSQFKIVDNPLATSSCGCGTSFDIKI
ncbi:hypothetical protein B0H63DRAFT_399536 [Podospora didyma]|uniref:FeS cluster biogenesis domain-containing protein n=1 Tax=Podospora didyma TaxID=330526 RepID=A0AAE0KEU1_9PEZI|nr:hypothetical protein B0H63DRAFT_399536 [Podospora didyma]